MQSFAYKVKSELCRQPVSRQCCARAEAYGVLLFCNTFTAAEVRIITENPEFAARLPRLFQRAFSLKFDSLPDGTRDKLIFRITQRHKLARIVDLLGFSPEQNLALHINFGLLEEECCRASFLRGAFLAGGSVTDPLKRYHLELATPHLQAGREVEALLRDMGYEPKNVQRQGNGVTYFKQSDHIEELLTRIGAPFVHIARHQPRVAVIRVDGFAGRRRDCGTWQFRRLVEERILPERLQRNRQNGHHDGHRTFGDDGADERDYGEQREPWH